MQQSRNIFSYLIGFIAVLAVVLGVVFMLTSGSEVTSGMPFWLIGVISVFVLVGAVALLGALFMKKTAKVNRDVNENDDSHAELKKFAEPKSEDRVL